MELRERWKGVKHWWRLYVGWRQTVYIVIKVNGVEKQRVPVRCHRIEAIGHWAPPGTYAFGEGSEFTIEQRVNVTVE